jgi:hypothetical protein
MHFPRILQHRPSPRAFDDLGGAQAAAAELTRALEATYSTTSVAPTEALCTQLVAFLESIAALDGRTVKRELDAFAELLDRVLLALARGQDQPGRYRKHWDECLTMCVVSSSPAGICVFMPVHHSFDYAALKMVPKHNGVYGRGEHKAYTSWRVDKLLLDSALGAPVGDVRYAATPFRARLGAARR